MEQLHLAPQLAEENCLENGENHVDSLDVVMHHQTDYSHARIVALLLILTNQVFSRSNIPSLFGHWTEPSASIVIYSTIAGVHAA